MLKHLLHIIFLLSLTYSGFTQVESHQSFKFSNTNPNIRQVYNLASAETDSAAINAGDYISNKYHFSSVSFNLDTALAIIDGPFTSIPIGYHIYFYSSASNANSVFLKINNLNPIEIKKHVTNPLTSGDILANNIYLAVYDGNIFQLLNPSIENCPSGYIAVNDRYCIQINENTATNFHNATIACGDQDANLCSIAQWVYACDNVVALQNMTDNFEWVNDAGNQVTQVKVFGENPSGVNGCDQNYTKTYTDIMNYRCCYNRK